MVVFHRAFMRRHLTTGVDKGMLLLGRRLREDKRRLDGAETGPEQNDREDEGDHPKGHG